MFIPHSGENLLSTEYRSFSGNALRCPWIVTLLYCSMSSLYAPGGRVLGTLSSGSLVVGAAGSDGVAVGVAAGGVICFEMDLCAATREAFKASR